MSFFSELKRRSVFRVAIAYLAFAWLAVQVAETLFPVFGLGTPLIRAMVVVLAIGFLPTLIFSWLYELTPEGFKLDSALDPRSRDRSGNKQFDRAIITVLTLAVGYFALDKFLLEPRRDIARDEAVARQARTEALQSAFAETSIAVLPFVNRSDDEGDEYFSDGISEDLLDLLGKSSKLRVISRSSSFSFKDRELSISDVADALDVAHVLRGSVRKTGDQMRINAELIDTNTETSLWSEAYDLTIEDVFTVQDEIAAAVLDKLDVMTPSDAPRAKETDPEAYNRYLQAKYLANQYTPESLASAADLYESALGIDPAYARAWSGLGWVYANQASSGHRPAKEALELAREATWTALAIDPDNARAYANVGWLSMEYDNDLSMAAHHYSRALSLDPNDVGIVNGAAVLTELLGRVDEAVALHEYSIARDPVDANRHSNLAIAYLSAGRPDDCIASIRTAMSLSPGRIGVYYLLGSALLIKGEAQDALEAFEREIDEEYRVKGRALALHDLGRQAEYEVAMQELREKWGDQWPSEVAQVYAWTGDKDAAFTWLDKAVAAKETGLMEQALAPYYAKLRDDSRWTEFLEERGHSAEQLAAIRFDVPLLLASRDPR